MTDYVIIEDGSKFPWTLKPSYETAMTELRRLDEENPTKWAGAKVVEFDTWHEAREAEYIDAPIVEITEERWFEMLEVLPPLAWKHENGVERFCMSEFTFGRITTQFARIQVSSNDPMGARQRYFEKSARFGDKSTYITRDNIPT